MKASLLAGGSVALAEVLRRDHDWDGAQIIAAPVAVIENGAVVETRWAALGRLEDLTFGADLVWEKAEKSVKVVVKVNDLKMFSFGCLNVSHWLDGAELDVKFFSTGGGKSAAGEISQEDAKMRGAGDFCLRLMIAPSSPVAAKLFVAALPFSKPDLARRMGGHAETVATPHITLQVKAEAPYPRDPNATGGRWVDGMLSQLEVDGEEFGIAVVPWLDAAAEGLEDAELPTSDDLKENTLRFLRNSTVVTSACTAPRVETRVIELLAGKPPATKYPSGVFPKFTPSGDFNPGTRGGSTGLSPSYLRTTQPKAGLGFGT
jgi:hypothetical protein